MLAYLLLVSNTGAPVDPDVVHRFADAVPAAVPFVAEERLTWQSDAGTAVFLGWQAFTEFAQMGSHWSVRAGQLTAFSGHLWPRETGWRSGASWASQLQRFLGTRNPAAVREELFGHFSIIALAPEGSGTVTTDFMNVDQLFVARAGTFCAISNRAGLAAQAVTAPGQPPTRSLLGAGWLACYGSILDEETGYWAVDRIPFGAHIDIDPRVGARMVEAARSPLTPPDVGSFPTAYEDILESVEHDLRCTMRTIASLPVDDLEVRLSGGKDSRVLAGIALSEDVADRFTFVTFGPPGKSDPIAARALASRYGFRWRLDDRSARPVAVERAHVLTHTSLVEGLTNSWDASGETIFSPGATVSGIAGEYLRWGTIALEARHLRTGQELIQLLRTRCGFDPLKLLRPDALAYYLQALEGWALDHLERGEDLERIGSFFMQESRARGRIGPNRSTNARLWLSPFITPVCVRANQRLAADRRPDLRFQFDLMRCCDPALPRLPFADDGWPDASIAHLPDADDYRAIRPVTSTAPDARNWRVVRFDDYRQLLESYLLDPDNPVFALLDFDRTKRQVQIDGSNAGSVRMLWGALTAAIWMGGHEQPAHITRGPV